MQLYTETRKLNYPFIVGEFSLLKKTHFFNQVILAHIHTIVGKTSKVLTRSLVGLSISEKQQQSFFLLKLGDIRLKTSFYFLITYRDKRMYFHLLCQLCCDCASNENPISK